MITAASPDIARGFTAAGPAPKKRQPMRDLIFVSLEDWDEIWRRNQFLCAEFAQRHPDLRILFVGLTRNFFREWKSTGSPPPLAPPAKIVPGLPNITLTHAWQFFPNRFAPGRWLNEWLERRHIRRETARLDLNRPVLWLNPHDAAHVAGRLGEAAVVYDVTDDWSKVRQSSARRRRTVRADARLCRRADAVIVCSEALRRDKSALSGNVHLVPNGVNTQHYAAGSGNTHRPPHSERWHGRIFGYTGTLHGDRIDVELIRDLAGIIGSAGSVVLIGPDHLSVAERSQLQLPNVFLIGAVPYADLPEYMRLFDVCIVPHQVTPFTESLNPIKLWEYLAFGKPVVATRVAGFREYPQFVYLAEGAEEFASRVFSALHEPARLTRERQEEAARHSWAIRCDTVEAILSDCLERDMARRPSMPAALSRRGIKS